MTFKEIAMKLKKIAALIAAAAISITTAGCGGAGNSSGSGEQSEAEQSASVDEINDEFDTSLTALELTAKIDCGWNLGNTFDATGNSSLSSETAWGNPTTTPEMIQTVKDAGFNAVRIPTTWEKHLDENNVIDSEWLTRVKEVVDYAYTRDMYVILNAHHEEWYQPYADQQEEISEKLAKVWTQIAEEFKDYDEHLIFEGMNEPRWKNTEWEWNGGNDEGRAVVNHLNSVFIDAVRATGGNNQYRFLMICPYAANCSESALSALEIPEDKNIIVSVHAYIPYTFALASSGTHLWLNDKASCVNDIDTLAEVLDRLFISKGIAVIIGETGAMNRYYTTQKEVPADSTAEAETITKANSEYRAAWAEYYFGKFKQLGIPCFWWDNGSFYSGETFGMLKRSALEWQYPEVLDGVMRGAGVK